MEKVGEEESLGIRRENTRGKNIGPVATKCASLNKVRFMLQGTKVYNNLF